MTSYTAVFLAVVVCIYSALPCQSFIPASPVVITHRESSSLMTATMCNEHEEQGSGSSCSKSGKSKSRRLYSFAEARKIARGHGFSSKQEFLEYDCAGAYQLPKDADVVWQDEWRGWDDFLGVPLTFEEGREVARALDDIKTKDDYLNLIRSKSLSEDSTASRLPYRPDLLYKINWISWDDFLQDRS